MDIYAEPDEDEFECDCCGEIKSLKQRCGECCEQFWTACKTCCACNNEMTVVDIMADLADQEYHAILDRGM